MFFHVTRVGKAFVTHRAHVRGDPEVDAAVPKHVARVIE